MLGQNKNNIRKIEIWNDQISTGSVALLHYIHVSIKGLCSYKTLFHIWIWKLAKTYVIFLTSCISGSTSCLMHFSSIYIFTHQCVQFWLCGLTVIGFSKIVLFSLIMWDDKHCSYITLNSPYWMQAIEQLRFAT